VNWTGNPTFFSAYGLPGHEGIDFQTEDGDEVFACADGIISRISLDGNDTPYGNQIRIRHDRPEGIFETIYANLKNVTPDLKIGDAVNAGDLIGLVGNTGRSKDSYLHLSLKKKGASIQGETPFPRDIMDPTSFLIPPGAVPHAEPTDNESDLGAPALPSAFNLRYRLQTDEIQFRRAWAWASGGGGNQRWLNLIANSNAPYSNALMRQAGTTLYVEDAIAYLNPQDPSKGTPRYWRASGTTFCNIFVNDVTRILHCEIPNNPANTSVSQMARWLTTAGVEAGWQATVSGREAQDFVNNGHVAIMIWSKKQGRDHVALVRPGEGVEISNFYWPRVAQAGTVISPNINSHDSFGELPTELLMFYLHE
jgi:hypothetical protein